MMQENIETTGKKSTDIKNLLRVEDWLSRLVRELAVPMHSVIQLAEWKARFSWQDYRVSPEDTCFTAG